MAKPIQVNSVTGDQPPSPGFQPATKNDAREHFSVGQSLMLFFANLILGATFVAILTGAGPSDEITRSNIYIGTLLGGLFTVGISFAMAGFSRVNWIRMIGLVRPKSGWMRGTVMAVSMYPLAMAMILISGLIARGMGVEGQQQQAAEDVMVSTGTPWALLFFVVIYAPIFEELIFRGAMMRAMVNSRIGVVGGFVLSSLIFAVVHDTIAAKISIFMFSLLLSFLAYNQRSIYPSMVLHAVFNGVAAIALTQG